MYVIVDFICIDLLSSYKDREARIRNWKTLTHSGTWNHYPWFAKPLPVISDLVYYRYNLKLDQGLLVLSIAISKYATEWGFLGSFIQYCSYVIWVPFYYWSNTEVARGVVRKVRGRRLCVIHSKKCNVRLPYIKHALNVRYKTYVNRIDRAPFV